MIQFNSICVFSTSHTQTLSVSRARHFYRFLFFFCEKKLHHNITFLFCSVCVLVSFSVSLVCPTKIERLCASVFFSLFLFFSRLVYFIYFLSLRFHCVSRCECVIVFSLDFIMTVTYSMVLFFHFNSSI